MAAFDSQAFSIIAKESYEDIGRRQADEARAGMESAKASLMAALEDVIKNIHRIDDNDVSQVILRFNIELNVFSGDGLAEVKADIRERLGQLSGSEKEKVISVLSTRNGRLKDLSLSVVPSIANGHVVENGTVSVNGNGNGNGHTPHAEITDFIPVQNGSGSGALSTENATALKAMVVAREEFAVQIGSMKIELAECKKQITELGRMSVVLKECAEAQYAKVDQFYDDVVGVRNATRDFGNAISVADEAIKGVDERVKYIEQSLQSEWDEVSRLFEAHNAWQETQAVMA